MDAQANLTVGSGEKRLSFRSSENASQTVCLNFLTQFLDKPVASGAGTERNHAVARVLEGKEAIRTLVCRLGGGPRRVAV